MKKILFIFLALVSFTVVSAQNILPRPNPPRLVNDAAGVLSPDQAAALEQKLVALDNSSSNQIAVVLIKNLGDGDIESYATKLFRDWGIGNKKTNNGILILAAIEDRKIHIEVGYGLEGAIPDITTSSIIRNKIAPQFKQQNYYQGLSDAIDDLAKAAVGEYNVPTNKQPSSSHATGTGSILTFLFIVFVVIMILSRGGRGGGGRGGGLGNIAEAVILSSLLGGGRGGGGGWGGGSSGGGGFGGFGGGSSGGGGASGSW